MQHEMSLSMAHRLEATYKILPRGSTRTTVICAGVICKQKRNTGQVPTRMHYDSVSIAAAHARPTRCSVCPTEPQRSTQPTALSDASGNRLSVTKLQCMQAPPTAQCAIEQQRNTHIADVLHEKKFACFAVARRLEATYEICEDIADALNEIKQCLFCYVMQA